MVQCLIRPLYMLMILLLTTHSSHAWFNFEFQLPHKTVGMDDFPREFLSILRDLTTIAGLTKEQSLSKRYDDFMQACSKFDWNDHLQRYFHREGLSARDIQYLRQMNISYLLRQMPRYNLDQFWHAPIGTLVYRTAFYFTRNGTLETFDMIKRIYVRDDRIILKRIEQFISQQPNATYIQWNEPQAINKRLLSLLEVLQFDETSAFLKLFNATNQLNYLTEHSFDYVNKVMSRLVFHKIQRNTEMIKNYTIQVNEITSKIQLLHSSIYHWSQSCQNVITDVVFTTATLDSISERCFGLPFSQTAHILYGINRVRGKFLGTFDMTSASIIAQSPYQNVTLQPAKTFIDKLIKGLEQIDKSKSLPYFEYARSTFIPWKTIEVSTISNILKQIQKLPWEVLSKAYGVSEASTSLQFVPFKNLEGVVKTATNSTFLSGTTRLRTVSVDVIIAAIERRLREQHLRVAYRANVLSLSSKPIMSLKYLYLLGDIDSLKSRTLFSICNQIYGIRLEEFLQYFGINSDAANFFQETALEGFMGLLSLDTNSFQRFSIKQIIDQIKPEWTFAEAMLTSPMTFITKGNSQLEQNLRFSIPQIVDHYHKNINSAHAFNVYLKVWSKSDEAALIMKETGLSDLAKRLKIETTVLANMKIIDIVKTVVISFGDECDLSQNKYCAVLQTCEPTTTGYRCRCNDGYRFSSTKTCEDLDECLFTNVTCHKNANCINTRGSYECQCKAGFTGSDGYNCFNINECETGDHNCHKDATCIDIAGTYQCNCKLGYHGNGRECYDLDECATNLHNCHHHATCTNEKGSFSCKCKPGFAGEGGQFCFDIDECERNVDDCPHNSVCKNTIGGFECNCKQPYVKSDNGKLCTECNKRQLKNCHADAICLSGTCVCKDGYRGNGKQCEDINECFEVSDICGHGRCSNIIGDYECSCTNGYRTTRQVKKCIDIDECSEPRGHLLCNGTDEICTNTDGGYACLTVKSDKAVKIALGTAIPLIVIMFIAIFIFWFLHRKHQGKKELDDFDKKLRQMYVNEAFTRDDESQVSGGTLRPIAPRGSDGISMNNYMESNKTFMNIFKKNEPDELNKTDY